MIRKRWIFTPSQKRQALDFIVSAFRDNHPLFVRIDYIMTSTMKTFSSWAGRNNYQVVQYAIRHACSDIWIYDMSPETAPHWLKDL